MLKFIENKQKTLRCTQTYFR